MNEKARVRQQVVRLPERHGAFLHTHDVVKLTGFSTKRRQIEQLQRMGVMFYVNGLGEPAVPRSILDPALRVEVVASWSPGALAEVQGAHANGKAAASKAGRRSPRAAAADPDDPLAGIGAELASAAKGRSRH